MIREAQVLSFPNLFMELDDNLFKIPTVGSLHCVRGFIVIKVFPKIRKDMKLIYFFYLSGSQCTLRPWAFKGTLWDFFFLMAFLKSVGFLGSPLRNPNSYIYFYFFEDYISFFLDGKGGRNRGRETLMCGCLSCTPYWGPDPQPRHVA